MNNDLSAKIDLTCSGTIEASAGCGKTYTIERLFCRLLTDMSANRELPQINQMIVITYTEKAAGELQDRLRRELRRQIASLLPTVTLSSPADITTQREILRTAERNFHGAAIGTIHSFCLQILTNYGYLTGSGAAELIGDQGGITELVARRARDFWTRRLPQTLAHLLTYYPIQKLIEIVTDLALQCDDPNTRAVISPFSPDNAETAEIENENPANERAEQLGEITAYSEFERAVAEFFTKRPENRDHKTTEETVAKKGAGKSSDRRAKKKKDSIPREYKFLLHAFARLEAKNTAAAWRDRKKRELKRSYSDMLRDLYFALGGDAATDTALLRELRIAYRYCIIDEFQDANNLVWKIFRKIFPAGDHARCLYLVGDPKQSIYSFQGANFVAYRLAAEELLATGGKRYSLAQNFRSSAALIAATNTLFADHWFKRSEIDFTCSSAGQTAPDYHAKTNGKEIAPVWYSATECKDHNLDYFLNGVLSKIFQRDQTGKTSLQIPIKTATGNTEWRNAELNDLVIVARTKNELQVVKKILEHRKIPHQFYKDHSLFSETESLHWLVLLRALLTNDMSGRNLAATCAALATIFFAGKLATLAEFNLQAEEWQKEIALIVKWREFLRRQPNHFSALFPQIIDDSGVSERLLANGETERWSRLWQIADFLITGGLAGKSLADLLQQLEKWHSGAESEIADERLVEITSDQKAIRLMTIHAAKGLEFPIVVLTGGNTKYTKHGTTYRVVDPRAQTIVSTDGDYQLPLANCEVRTIAKYEIEQQYAEYERLFYVALTRAQFLLVLPLWAEKRGGGDNPAMWLKRIIQRAQAENPDLFYAVDSNYSNFMIAAEKESIVFDFPADLTSGAQKISAEAKLFSTRRPARALSYSTLISGESAPREQNINYLPADDEIFPLRINEIAENPEPLFVNSEASVLPRGRETGNALHQIFQEIDFNSAAENASALQKCNADLFNRAIDRHFFALPITPVDRNNLIAAAAEIVFNTLHSQIPSAWNKQSFQLRSITPAARSSEMFFQINVRRGGTWQWGGARKKIEQTLLGHIDLVAKISSVNEPNRYLIVDWKSNFLPNYAPEILVREMVSARYDLQRAIYARALHEWLQSLLPAYRYEENFGGVYYAFVRGCRAGTPSGWLVWRPSAVAEIDAAITELLRE